MKTSYLLIAGMLLLAGCSQPKYADRRQTFSDGWLFVRDSIAGAEAPDYDDSDWTAVDLPHDFSILPLPGGDTEDQVGPFSKQSPGVNSTGHTVGGTGWYRKTFRIEASDEDRRITLLFDGAYMTTDVWVNGVKMGQNRHGYTPFAFDITPALRPVGEDNVVAVRVVNYGRNSRWYSGSGLYRDVYLIKTSPLHVDLWGAYITTPEVTRSSASVDVAVTVRNDGAADAAADVTISIRDKGGKVVAATEAATTVPAASVAAVKGQVKVTAPVLWSTETPYLYNAEITVSQGGKVTDVYTQPFGIRSIEFTADRGFLLNGEPVLLKGGCLHHDHGLLGAKAFRSAEYRRVEMMRENGYNAIRCSHNPPSVHLLNAADELGVLIIDEFTDQWNYYKNPQDYSRAFSECWESDLTRMMLRDRNHPSVIMWSIGNEIPKKTVEEGASIAKMLRDKVKQLDDTRAVTEAICNYSKEGGWDMTKPWMDVLDVCGYNYMDKEYASDHEKYPERVMYGSETYPGKAYENWSKVEQYPYVIGDFVWTAMDYLGEVLIGKSEYVKDEMAAGTPTVNNLGAFIKMLMSLDPEPFYDMINSLATSAWPAYNGWCGDIDLIGGKKPQGLYRDVLWDESVIEMNVHEPVPDGMKEQVSDWGWQLEYPSWTWAVDEGTPLQVRVFTKAPQVRLMLDGEVIDERTVGADDKLTATFTVPYKPGTLTAVALRDGEEVGRKALVTAGEPRAVKLTVSRDRIRADRGDLSFVRIDIVDEDGVTVPESDVRVNISVTGGGELVGSGNASADDMESFGRTSVRVYRGQALAVIRPFAEAGSITVTVTADGLTSASATIKVQS